MMTKANDKKCDKNKKGEEGEAKQQWHGILYFSQTNKGSIIMKENTKIGVEAKLHNFLFLSLGGTKSY